MGFIFKITRFVVLVLIISSTSEGTPSDDNADFISPENNTTPVVITTNATTPVPPTTMATTMATTKATTMATTMATTTATTTATTPAAVMTTATGDMTTASGNMTTSFTTNATTSIPTTIPPSTGKWDIKKDGKTCMKIQLGGTVSIPIIGQNKTVVVEIPPTGSAAASQCMDKISIFNLQSNVENETDFVMNLKFEKSDTTYKMIKIDIAVKVIINEPPLPPSFHYFTGDRSYDILEAPHGRSYACPTQVEEFLGMTLTLTDEKFQPFGEIYGDVFNCGDPFPEDAPKPKIGLIIFLSCLSVIVIGGILGFFILRIKKKRGVAYNQM